MGFVEKVVLQSPIRLSVIDDSKVDFLRILQSYVTIVYKLESITGLEELE